MHLHLHEDCAARADLELLLMGADTKVRQFKPELVWNDAAYGIKSGRVSQAVFMRLNALFPLTE